MEKILKLAKQFEVIVLGQIPMGTKVESAQPADLTKVLYKSGILGWKAGAKDLRTAPPMDLQSNTANKIFDILDKYGSDSLAATINVHADGSVKVQVTASGGRTSSVVSDMGKVFNQSMTAILRKAKSKPASTVNLQWITKIGYK